jgi:HlyD family secretion protein
MSNRLKWIIGILLGAILVFFILKLVFKPENRTKVAVELSEKRTLVESVSASGKLYPENEIRLSPDVSGEVVVLTVAEGDSVRKGQLLATINSQLYKSQVQRAQAQLKQTKSSAQSAQSQKRKLETDLRKAKSMFNEARKQFNTKSISLAAYEAAIENYKMAQANYSTAMASSGGNQYQVANARASVKEAQQQLNRTSLYSPMNGVVSVLNVKKGERVMGSAQMSGTEMMRIMDMSTVKVDVDVVESDIVKIKVGDSAKVIVEAYGKQVFNGRVDQIKLARAGGLAQTTGSANSQVTNYTVSVTLNPQSYEDLQQTRGGAIFRPGMSATVDIYTRRKENVQTVPINAVTTREDESQAGNYSDIIKEYVFVDSAGYAVLRSVKTGLQDNQYVEIIEGLKGKEKVLIAPYGAIARTLKNKDKIKKVDKEDLYEDE